ERADGRHPHRPRRHRPADGAPARCREPREARREPASAPQTSSAVAMRFLDRVRHLPRLGLGVSTEYGAGAGREAIDVLALRTEHPDWAGFLEIGVETARGLDRHAEAWVARGGPTTYHYLDVNLDEPEDFDAEWVEDVRAIAARLRPAWRCGDAAL